MIWIWMLMISLLSACSPRHPLQGSTMDEIENEFNRSFYSNQNLNRHPKNINPAEVSKTLMPGIKFRSPKEVNYQHTRFDIAVKSVPAQNFFLGLVKDMPINIIVSPEITGEISLNLKNVTIPEILTALEHTYGYVYSEIPGGYEIVPNKLQTKIYSVNYLELQRSGQSEMKLHSGEVTEVIQNGASNHGGSSTTSAGNNNPSTSASNGFNSGSSIGRVKTVSTIDFWEQLENTLKDIVGNEANQRVSINKIAGVVVVHAYPKELKQIDAYLNLVQNSMNRQVVLEAKILEVTLNDAYQMGIDWEAQGLHLNSIHPFPRTNLMMSDFPAAYTATIDWAKNFTTTIQALERQGMVQVLSSPRVATMNNQQSLIKVGSDEFFVSGISAGQASGFAVSQPSETISPFFSGITLDVTPQIDAEGNVTLHIHPSVSEVTEQIKLLSVGSATPTPTSLASSTIRESDTIVHAKNGQIIIIGGLMQNQRHQNIAQVPVLGKIPFMGSLFRATKQTSVKSELVILLKATAMGKENAERDLNASKQRFMALNQGFLVGGRPDIYGTEGETPMVLGPKVQTAKAGHHPLQKIRGSE